MISKKTNSIFADLVEWLSLIKTRKSVQNGTLESTYLEHLFQIETSNKISTLSFTTLISRCLLIHKDIKLTVKRNRGKKRIRYFTFIAVPFNQQTRDPTTPGPILQEHSNTTNIVSSIHDKASESLIENDTSLSEVTSPIPNPLTMLSRAANSLNYLDTSTSNDTSTQSPDAMSW